MNAGAVKAGAHATTAFFSLAGGSVVSSHIPAITLKQAVFIFLIAAGKFMLDYLDKHPLPVLQDAEPKTK